MEQGLSKRARRFSRIRSIARAYAAAILAAAFLSSCGGRAVPGGAAADPRGMDGAPPVFPFGKALREAGPAAPALFALPGGFRPRAISRFGKAYLGWDNAAKRLRLLDGTGREKASWPMEAAFVWVSGDLALSRSALFSDGPVMGFGFALYRVNAKKGPKELWSATLDCFPSDVIFAEGGIVYLAGAVRADGEHSVYRVRAEAAAERILRAPKNADFLRLVASGGDVLAFASARDREKRPRTAYLLEKGTEGFSEIRLTGLPDAVLCAYGYGFAFGGGFVVPMAMADGDLALARFERKGGRLDVAALSPGAKGCYLPLGSDPGGTCFWYLARDATAEPEASFLGRYDSRGVSLTRIE